MTTIAISVSAFKAYCLDMIRQVEQAGVAIDLTRRGKVVARLVPTTPASKGTPTWLRLRGRGRLTAAPGESIFDAAEFNALKGSV
jgi:antitoxin (DNA-binding transcriptional repressor) of toxin-antitoxin stability system